MRAIRLLIGLFLAIALLGAILSLEREPLKQAIGDFLVVEDELHPADVIHVIAGMDHRMDYGIRLFQQGMGERLLFTGGWCKTHRVYHAQRSRRLAIALGVPDEAIIADGTPITSTYTEALRLKATIDRSEIPIRSVIVVSDPYHMRRARWTYRHVLGDQIEVQMAPVPFEKTHFQRVWWTDHLSSETVKEEYLKLGYYFARYGLNIQPLSSWLASMDTE